MSRKTKSYAFIWNRDQDDLPVFLGTEKGVDAQEAFNKFLKANWNQLTTLDEECMAVEEVLALELSKTWDFEEVTIPGVKSRKGVK